MIIANEQFPIRLGTATSNFEPCRQMKRHLIASCNEELIVDNQDIDLEEIDHGEQGDTYSKFEVVSLCPFRLRKGVTEWVEFQAGAYNFQLIIIVGGVEVWPRQSRLMVYRV